MVINPILKEKYDSQKKLNEKANNDLRTYVKNSHRNVSEIARKYGFKLKFADKSGGYLKSTEEEPAGNIV